MPVVLAFEGTSPSLGRDVFLAETATLVGQVTLGDESSVWFGTVLRGDVGTITVGRRTNLQDLVVVHMTSGVSHARIGDDVTVGHGAILHGCDVGDRCLVGMGSILLDDVVVGAECVIAAGSLLPPRMVVPRRSLVRGRPAKVVRAVTDEEARMGAEGALHYLANARKYRYPPPTK
ncbi:MAG TPA: gamma carbonic anhydrase family protein [Polyangiaceae bacterium]|nr:gamma carbonic anhydrase family protein [Polyangiaceae bacterium]